jgi:transmembrane sensor
MSKKGRIPPLTFDKILMQPDFAELIKSRNKEVEENDQLRPELEKASFIYRVLSSHKKFNASDGLKKHQLNRLLSRIAIDEKSKSNKNLSLFLKIAASILILVILASLVIWRDIPVLAGWQERKLELDVPSGEKSKAILADGTTVWINSESKLIYPVGFRGRERKVILEGEAYFDVTKVKKSPFVVYTQDVRVQVLGTKFNVKSYPKDRTIETTVVEGSVRVEDEEEKVRFSPVLLKSSERMVLQKEYPKEKSTALKKEIPKETIQKIEPSADNEIMISHVNPDNITCWKDHLLVFDNESLEEIALKMSRWYKVQVMIMDPELKTQHYTGKFVNNESIEQVLEAINLTTPIHYTMNKTDIQIWSKPKK